MRLIDADALYRDMPMKVCLPCPFGEEKECEDCVIDDVMKVIDEAPTIQAPRWVRCEDDKPKERDYYFAFTADAEAFVGEYVPSVDQWWNGDDLTLTVTHWMPIEPPKEGV